MSERSPHISVVVCTYNRRDLLVDAVESLLGQRTEGKFTYDIVIVDNGSVDGTRDVGQSLASSESLISYHYEPQPGVAAARNCGVRVSQGEWIAFFDDDQIADPRWLVELLSYAIERQARVVGGAVRLDLPEHSRKLPVSVRRLFGETVVRKPREYSRKFSPGTGNMLVARSVFAEVGNFDVELRQAGEDTDLYRRMRNHHIRAWFTPIATVYHRVPVGRLEYDSLRILSERTGWVFALRDRIEMGLGGIMACAAARLLQTVMVHVPAQLVHSVVRQCPWRALGRRTLIWRTIGYLRGTAFTMSPRRFAQPDDQQHSDFRLERSAPLPHITNQPVTDRSAARNRDSHT